jgi:hypothetical protein
MHRGGYWVDISSLPSDDGQVKDVSCGEPAPVAGQVEPGGVVDGERGPREHRDDGADRDPAAVKV